MAESIDQRMSYGKVTLGHICMVIELDSPLPGGTVQAVQQASVHTNEGGTEKLLALTVPVPWPRASMTLVPFTHGTCTRHGRKGCCTSDLLMPLREESNAACMRSTWFS